MHVKQFELPIPMNRNAVEATLQGVAGILTVNEQTKEKGRETGICLYPRGENNEHLTIIFCLTMDDVDILKKGIEEIEKTTKAAKTNSN